MRSELIRILNNLTRRRKNREAFRRFVSALSAIVVFVTTYALILPAITMTVAPGCGMEEHTHSDSCYEITVNEETGEETKELTCGKEEHTHSEACYEAAAEQIEERNRERREAQEAEEPETLVFEETTQSAPVETEVTGSEEEETTEDQTTEGETEQTDGEQTAEGEIEESHTDEQNTDSQTTDSQTTEDNNDQITDGQTTEDQTENNEQTEDQTTENNEQTEEHHPIENHEAAEELQHELEVVKEELSNEDLTDEEKAALEEEAKKLEEELAAELAEKEAEEKAAAAQELFAGRIAQLKEELSAMTENEELTIEEIEALEAKLSSLREELSAEDTDLTEEAAAELDDAAAELAEQIAELKAATEERIAAQEEEKYAARLEIEHVDSIEAVIYTGSSYETEADDSTTITVSGKLPVAYYLDRETDEEKNELAVEVRAYATDASRIRVNDEARAILSYDITIFYKDEFRTEETGETFQPEGSLQVSFESPQLAKSDDDMTTVYSVYHVPEDEEPVLVAEESAAVQEAKLRAIIEEEVEANNELIDEINRVEKEAAEAAPVNEVLTAIVEEAKTEEELLEKVAVAVDEQAAAVMTNISASMPDVPEQPVVDEVEITDISEVASGVAEMITANMIASLNAEEAEETSEDAQVEVTVNEQVGHLQLEKEEATGKITFEAKHFSEYAVLATTLDASHDINEKIRVTGISVLKNGTQITETNEAQAYDQHTLVIDLASNLEFLRNQIRANDYFDVVLPKEFKYGSGSFRALTFGPITARGDIYEDNGNKILHVTVTSIGQAIANEASFSFLAQVPFNLDELEPNSTKTITASMKDGSSNASTTIKVGYFAKRLNGQVRELTNTSIESMALLPQSSSYYTGAIYGLQIGWKWVANADAPDLRAGDHFTIKLPTNLDYITGVNSSFNLLNMSGQLVATAELDQNAKTLKVTFTDYINDSDDYIYAEGRLTVDVSGSTVGVTTLTAEINNRTTNSGIRQISATFKDGISLMNGSYVLAQTNSSGAMKKYYERSSFAQTRDGVIQTFNMVEAGTNYPTALNSVPWSGNGSDNYVVTYCVEESNNNLIFGGIKPTNWTFWNGKTTYDKHPIADIVNYYYRTFNYGVDAAPKQTSATLYTETQAQKLEAIIQNSYPYVSLETMKARLGLDYDLDVDIAIAATQLAIWRVVRANEPETVVVSALPTYNVFGASDLLLVHDGYPSSGAATTAAIAHVKDLTAKLLAADSNMTDSEVPVGFRDVSVTSVERKADGTVQYTIKVTLDRPLRSSLKTMFKLEDGQGNTKTMAVAPSDLASDNSFEMTLGNVNPDVKQLSIKGKIIDEDGRVEVFFYENDTFQNQIGGISTPFYYDLTAEITLKAKTEIKVNKIWKNVTPNANSSVKVALYGDYGDEHGNTQIGETVELKAPTWSHTFTDLRYYMEDGKTPINYTVKEISFVLDGTTYTVNDDGSTGSGIVVSNGVVRTVSGSFSNGTGSNGSGSGTSGTNSQASAFGSIFATNRTGLSSGLAASLSRMRGVALLDPVDIDKDKALSASTKSSIGSGDDGHQIFIRRDDNGQVLTYTGNGISWQPQVSATVDDTYDNVRRQLWIVRASGDTYSLQNLYNSGVWLSVDRDQYWKAGSSADHIQLKGGANNEKVLLVSDPYGYGDMYWKWMKPNGYTYWRDGLTYYSDGASAVTFGEFNEALNPGTLGCGSANYVIIGGGEASYEGDAEMVIHQEATITNTLTQGNTEIIIKKVWETPDQTLPVSATVRLLQDGVFNPGFEYVLDRSNNWTVKVENLAYYKPGTMEPIKYTVEEVSFKYGNEVYINDANLSQKGFSVNVTGPVLKTNSGSGNNSQASAAGSVYMLNTTSLRSNRMASLGRMRSSLLLAVDPDVTNNTSVSFEAGGTVTYYDNGKQFSVRNADGTQALAFDLWADEKVCWKTPVEGQEQGTYNSLRRQLWTAETVLNDGFAYFKLRNVFNQNYYLKVGSNGSLTVSNSASASLFSCNETKLKYNGIYYYDNGATYYFHKVANNLVSGNGLDYEAGAQPQPTTIPVTGIALNRTSLSMVEGGDVRSLSATVEPEDATDNTVMWSSSNLNVATVDYSGSTVTVTSVGTGTATITATASNGMTATCSVEVLSASSTVPTDIVLTSEEITLYVGDTMAFDAEVMPATASDKTITWGSTHPSIAKFEQGVIVARGAGTAQVYASTSNGITKYCKVNVLPRTSGDVEVSSIALTPTAMELTAGDATGTITANIAPNNATNKNITWTSSNLSVATVSADGVVTPLTQGTTTITASTANGKTAECIVTVKAAGSGEQGGDDPVVIGNVITQEFTVTNSINGTAEIQVRKVWSGFGSETDNAQVTVELLEKVGDKEVAVDYSYVNGVKTNRAVLTWSNGWTAKWTGLNQSKLRNYVVKEIGVTGANLKYFTSESWNADHSQVTITNTKDTPLTYKTHVHVVKVWEDNNRLNVPNITVTLLQNGVPYTDASPLVLNDSNQWSGWFRDLPAYDSNGRQYIYTVDETVPAGYDSVSPVKTEYSDIVEVLQNASSGSSTATYYGGSEIMDSLLVPGNPAPRRFSVMTRGGSSWNKITAFCLNHEAHYPEDIDENSYSVPSYFPQYIRTTINNNSELSGHIDDKAADGTAYKRILKAVYYGAGNDADGIGGNLSEEELIFITQMAIYDVTNYYNYMEWDRQTGEVTWSTGGISNINNYSEPLKGKLLDAYKELMKRVLLDKYNGPINSLTMHVYEHKSGTGYLGDGTYQTLFSIEAVKGITTRTATITNTSNLTYGKIKAVKFGDDTNAGIDGVPFSLYEAYTPAAGETNVPTIKFKGNDITVKWLADYVTAEVAGEHGIIVTDPKGDFPGLEDGKTYYLVETAAPAGYKKLAEPIEFVIMANANKTEWLVGGDVKEAIAFKPAATDGEQLGTIRVKNEKLYFNFDLIKVAKDAVSADAIEYLQGAKFLLIDAGSEDADGGLYVGSNGGSRLPSGYVIDPATGRRAPYADNYNSYVIVTGNDGRFHVNNLLPNKPNRQYILVEIEAPENYWKQSQVSSIGLDADCYSFTVELVSASGNNVLQMTQGANEGHGFEQSDKVAFVDGTVQITVGNVLAYYELPSTGGAGTNMFTLGGIIIMALAAALLMYRKINDMRKEVA